MTRHPPVALHPFDGLDLGWLLASQARARGGHPWLVFEPFDGPTVTISYAEFDDRARRLAWGLRRRGVLRGDRVLVHLDNCAEYLVAWCACGLLGAVAVTTNTRCSLDELQYFAGHSEPVFAITQPRHAALVRACGGALRGIAVTDNDSGVPAAGAAARPADERFEDLLAQAPPSGPLAALSPLDPLAIQYTSGTTARPKAVLWTHANALWAGRVGASHEALRADDVHLCVLPLCHTNALSYSALAAFWAGATLVLMPRFSSSRFWSVAQRHRCTWSSITAFCYRALFNVERPAHHHFRNWGVAFADPRIPQEFGIRTVSWWGMTETISQGIVGLPHLPHRDGAIGRAAPEYGIRIVDPDGRQVARGETGTLKIDGVRGVSLFAEYFRDPQATSQAFDHEGFFETGDRVTLLDDGAIRFADRARDMLKVGGENVASSEIERVIAGIDGIAEVAVVARPHPMLDEVPVAFVRTEAPLSALSEDEVRVRVLAACRTQIADFKQPREVHVVEDFPRASVEKVSKSRLRELWDPVWRARQDGRS
ncbi:MAG TPA: AMP-binding protein [Zeimonas sp.]|nr:AMP-binding protein [Zeimonas sp.]